MSEEEENSNGLFVLVILPFGNSELVSDFDIRISDFPLRQFATANPSYGKRRRHRKSIEVIRISKHYSDYFLRIAIIYLTFSRECPLRS